ncbi:HIRAN domain-containing protein [Clostridium sp. 001]|uniref:HIRAN domain-containing protein n=1 Tax=Clostridium sp. 001 TaxID=1970093 RepID=UPI001C2C24E1|nr:HIRAN domain-containing protein [Clostridium sp. 001]QXE20677.1 hypothetical protein B5S50_18465 [Clostridium sp. 001]
MDDKALIKINTSGTSLINSFSTGNLPMPYTNEIFLLNIWIAGLNYYEAHSIEDELNVEDKLLLKRESKNQYDNLAIEIYDAKNRKLGYVPKAKNEVISRLMDGGKLLYGIITEIEYEYLEISADIFMSDF